jgi:Ca-activated chloride channel family protein
MILRVILRNTIWAILLVLVTVNIVISLRILRPAKNSAGMPDRRTQSASSEPGGELRIRGTDGRVVGACPLQHTEVDADIAGFITRVHVRQTFANPLDRKIEAVYVFPLPQDSAVDDMAMTIGDRRIVGKIQPREQARQTYEAARSAGHVASLLDQERPNIFTQSVANIEPGAQVVVEITYVETLKYEDGAFTFVFPMVVGPRYMPSAPTGGQGGVGVQESKTGVPDADRISPPITMPPTRAGHDIGMTVRIDGGAELFDIKSELHAIRIQQAGPNRATVTLQNEGEIPNRDFILRYRTATEQIKDAFFVHPFPGGAYFTLSLLPPRRVDPAQARPKEMIFVIDRSGSQQGFPIEKAKETMRRCIQDMNPDDTFNLLSFSNDVTRLFDHAAPNTPDNRAQALRYLDGVQADGGTEMLPALRAALDPPADPRRVRIVGLLTDGFVGNDFEIIDAVRKYAGTARVFTFGIGNSVNRFLLDGVAHAGRGEVEYVTLEKEGSAAAERFHERIQSPVLTDLQIDWGSLKADDVYPRQLPDLFSDRPILIHGLLKGAIEGVITLRGLTGQGPFLRRIPLHPPSEPEPHAALASLWARAKVADLMTQDLAGLQSGNMRDNLKQAITDLGVRYRLLTQFTSFVAVEEDRRTEPGKLTQVSVPVEKPDGVSDNLVAGGSNNQVVAGDSTLVAQSRPGDPLIRVRATPDAEQVIALLPGGEIKRLLFNPERGEWQARFDIPTYAADGDYFVRVIFVLKDGRRRMLQLRYRVDTTAPTGRVQVRLLSGPASTLHLELEADEETARVVALLPWGERTEMTPANAQQTRYSALQTIPAAYQGKQFAATFILTDRAHNRTTVTVDASE